MLGCLHARALDHSAFGWPAFSQVPGSFHFSTELEREHCPGAVGRALPPRLSLQPLGSPELDPASGIIFQELPDPGLNTDHIIRQPGYDFQIWLSPAAHPLENHTRSLNPGFLTCLFHSRVGGKWDNPCKAISGAGSKCLTILHVCVSCSVMSGCLWPHGL